MKQAVIHESFIGEGYFMSAIVYRIVDTQKIYKETAKGNRVQD